MDMQRESEAAGINRTPAKASRDAPSLSASSLSSSLQSPNFHDEALVSPAISYLARKTSGGVGSPPVLSTKPRRASKLFPTTRGADKEGFSAADDVDERCGDDGCGRSASKTTTSLLGGGGKLQRDAPSGFDRTWRRSGSGHSERKHADPECPIAVAVSDTSMAFASPSKISGGGVGVGGSNTTDRYTPQRNLGGLFLSPSPKQDHPDDAAPTSITTSRSNVPVPRQCSLLLQQSPGWEDSGVYMRMRVRVND